MDAVRDLGSGSCKLEQRNIFNLIERNTGCNGNSKTKLANLKDAIQLVMMLPGKVAKETQAQYASIIERHLLSNKKLEDEMKSHATFSTPVHVPEGRACMVLGF